MNKKTKSKKQPLSLADWEAWLVADPNLTRKRGRPLLMGEKEVARNLSQGILVSPEDEDLLVVRWEVSRMGYVRRGFKGSMVIMHRIICRRVIGAELNPQMEVDHRNHIPYDNRRENLRYGDKLMNMNNRWHNRPNKSGFIGVVKARKNWEVYIKINRKSFNLGTFTSPVEGAMAYDFAARSLGRTDLNFPPPDWNNDPNIRVRHPAFVIQP